MNYGPVLLGALPHFDQTLFVCRLCTVIWLMVILHHVITCLLNSGKWITSAAVQKADYFFTVRVSL